MSSEAPPAKRQKAGPEDQKQEDAPYRLIYWPGLPGRGEHIRLVFEEAGVPYIDTAQAEGGLEELLALVSGKDDKDRDENDKNIPPLAPPVLQHGDLRISQTSNILQYLGTRFGLAGHEDNDVYRVNALALTALDGLSDEVHDCHHPICTQLYYEDQKPESLRRSKRWVTLRLPKFLGYFERVLASSSRKEGNFLLGDLTYADLVLFQCLDGTSFMFPKAVAQAKASGDYARVFGLYDAVKARPNIAAYLGSSRRQKYANGIYRYYPELDVLPDEGAQ